MSTTTNIYVFGDALIITSRIEEASYCGRLKEDFVEKKNEDQHGKD